MISIQAYRMAIGCFQGKARFLTTMSKNQKVLNIARTRKNITYDSGSVETWRKTTKIMPLICISVLLGLGLRSCNTLIIDGDVESNPGPTYVTEKTICGSYHQSDRRFGDIAGVQFACNSLYALCLSQIRTVGFWNRLDLDHKLTEGDSLYKTLNTFDMPSVDDLPCFVRMYDENVQIEFLQLETNLASLTFGDPSFKKYFVNY